MADGITANENKGLKGQTGAILCQVLPRVKMQELAVRSTFLGIALRLLKLSVKKSIDLFALSLYIGLFQGQSEASRSRSETPTCEAKSGKKSIFGVRSRIYSG
jgi:hypothetical protein